jgi:hypothetical protein
MADQEDLLVAQSHLDLYDRVRRRAHEIWKSHSHDRDTALKDWLEAEREIVGEDAHQPAQDRATVVGPA